MVNSTFVELTDKNGGTSASVNAVSTWNPDYGYGRLDAWRAYQTLLAGQIIQDKLTQRRMGWAYDTMPQNSEHVYRLSGHQNQQLVTTVTWHRKLIQLSSARFLDAPAFYLNLKIISPAGKVMVFEIGDQNNLMKTDYLLSEDGEYKIVLQNPTQTDGRDYGMAFEFVDSTPESPVKPPIKVLLKQILLAFSCLFDYNTISKLN